jgi:hypothetical protein
MKFRLDCRVVDRLAAQTKCASMPGKCTGKKVVNAEIGNTDD